MLPATSPEISGQFALSMHLGVVTMYVADPCSSDPLSLQGEGWPISVGLMQCHVTARLPLHASGVGRRRLEASESGAKDKQARKQDHGQRANAGHGISPRYFFRVPVHNVTLPGLLFSV